MRVLQIAPSLLALTLFAACRGSTSADAGCATDGAEPEPGAIDLVVVLPATRDAPALSSTRLSSGLARALGDWAAGTAEARIGFITSNLGQYSYSQWGCQGLLAGADSDGAALVAPLVEDSAAECAPASIVGTARWPAFLETGSLTAESVSQATACIVDWVLDHDRCEVYQPLEAAARVAAANPEFLRPRSVLGVLIVASCDDFSTGDPALWDEAHFAEAGCLGGYASPEYLVPTVEYLERFRALHEGPVIFGLLGAAGALVIRPPDGGCPLGSPEPLCAPQSLGGVPLYPAPRLAALRDAAEGREAEGFGAVWLDFCAEDLAPEVSRFLGALSAAAAPVPCP